MKLPRDVSGRNLAKALHRLGYETTRHSGSHMRLTTRQDGEHHLTIPDHDAIRPGLLSAILADVAGHHGLERDDLIVMLFGE
ncbi:MAG: type II toxin-antitoxin system HicA family toxin [Dongiaceae bacterium]